MRGEQASPRGGSPARARRRRAGYRRRPAARRARGRRRPRSRATARGRASDRWPRRCCSAGVISRLHSRDHRYGRPLSLHRDAAQHRAARDRPSASKSDAVGGEGVVESGTERQRRASHRPTRRGSGCPGGRGPSGRCSTSGWWSRGGTPAPSVAPAVLASNATQADGEPRRRPDPGAPGPEAAADRSLHEEVGRGRGRQREHDLEQLERRAREAGPVLGRVHDDRPVPQVDPVGDHADGHERPAARRHGRGRRAARGSPRRSRPRRAARTRASHRGRGAGLVSCANANAASMHARAASPRVSKTRWTLGPTLPARPTSDEREQHADEDRVRVRVGAVVRPATGRRPGTALP